MQHHLIGGQFQLQPFQTVEDVQVFFERLAKSEVGNRHVPLCGLTQLLMRQKCPSREPVARAFGDYTMKFAIKPEKSRTAHTSVFSAEKVLHLLAYHANLLTIR